MSSSPPLAARYLRAFSDAMARARVPEREDITREIESHIAEAQAAGRPLADVLAALGPPEALARAYAVEEVIAKRGPSALGSIGGLMKLLAIVFASGVLTMIVATALGSIGLTFLASGVLISVIGVLEAAGIHLPNVQLAGLSPWAVIAMGPAFFGVGWVALWGLARYTRALVATLRRALPTRRANAS